MKSILTHILVAVLTAMGALYVVNWQEEDLRFDVSEPMYFGEVIYQNIRITNKGWNPAENVKISFSTKTPVGQGNKEFRSYPPMNIDADDKEMTIGGYDRIRKGEWITLTFLSNDNPIKPETVIIKSDRSIASVIETPIDIDYSFWVLMCVLFLVFLAIALPAYKDYQEAKNKAYERRAAFNFRVTDIPIGATLVFVKDEDVSCEVVSNKKVRFAGEEMSVSLAAQKALEMQGLNWKAVQGPVYWQYEGETLDERRRRLEESDD